MKKVFLLSLFAAFCIGLLFTLQIKTHAEGTYTNIGTSDAANSGSDGINFSQGRVWTVDQYGKYIWITEDNGGNHHFAYSNDSGTSWTQTSYSDGFMTRASVAYDAIHDKLHVVWYAQSNSDGIIYRRYAITRDASHNITNISLDSPNVSVQLDSSSSNSLEQPVATWVNDGSANGSIVAVWSKYGSTFSETRASMRHLSNDANDGIASNWTALTGTADTFTDAPLVSANKIYAGKGSNGSSVLVRGGNSVKKNDLYVFVAENDQTDSLSRLLSYRLAWNSLNKDWSNGLQSPVLVGQVNNYAGGYNLKYQLLTRPVLDSTNDRLYIGWARWKDNTAGDTWSIAYLDSNDAPSGTTDLYSANGAHAYAPTGDIAYDQTAGLIYASYVESTTNGTNGSIDYKTYDGTTLSPQTRFYTNTTGIGGANGGADIPTMFENRQNNRLLFAFRVNGSLPPTAQSPHTLDWGYVALGNPTPTPTPATPTAVNLNLPGGADQTAHQVVRTNTDHLYLFVPQAQFNTNVRAYWTTTTGLPTAANAFTGSASANITSDVVTDDAVYDGANTIHILTYDTSGTIKDTPFDTTTNQFKPSKIISIGNPTVSTANIYSGTEGVTGMIDTAGVMHISFWSSGNHISYASYTYDSASDTLTLLSGPTQVDTTGASNHPAIAVNPSDNSITVAWVSQATSPAQILTRTRSTAGSWGAVETVSSAPVWTSTNAGINIDQGPSLVIDSAGVKYIDYIQDFDNTGDYGKVHFAVSRTPGTWTDTPLQFYSHDPVLALNTAGEMYIIGHGSHLNPTCTDNNTICYAKRTGTTTFANQLTLIAPSGTNTFDTSLSPKWSVVGWNSPETIEYVTAAVVNGSYVNTNLWYGYIPATIGTTPTPTPTPGGPTNTPTPTSLPTSTPTPTNTPTPTIIPTATPTPQPQGTVTTQVAASTDDVIEDGTTYSETGGEWIGNGSSATASYTGLRFRNINIPKGATIQSAILSVNSSQSQWINVSMSMAAEATGNSVTFSSSNQPSQRTLTTANISYSDGSNWAANTWYTLPDISSVIQEITNRSDWTAGNPISLIFKGTGGSWGRKFIESFDSSAANAPKLVITYTTPITVTPTPTAAPTPVPTYNQIGTVYIDANGNGVQDANETAYSGATVTLSGASSGTTTTDASGNYSFTGLPQGSYTITLSVPSGYTATTTNPVLTQLTGTTTTNVTNFGVTIAPTSTPTPLPTNTPTPTSSPTPTSTPMPTVTPTPVPAYTLSGTVYNDTNNNGIQDTNEAGYANATVTLSNGQSVVTNSTGSYTFTNIPAGTYTETLTIPSGYVATTANPVTVALAADTTVNYGLVVAPTNTPTPTFTPSPTPTNTPTPSPTPSFAIPAIVQSAQAKNGGSVTSLKATFTSSVTTGDTAVVAISSWNSASTVKVSSVTDSKGNVYTKVVEDTTPNNSEPVSIWYATNVTGGSNFAVTATLNTAGSVTMAIHEYKGIATVSALDATVHQNASGTSATSGSTSTTQTEELLLGAFVNTSGNTITATAGSGFTLRQTQPNDASYESLYTEDRIISVTGLYAATLTFAKSTTYRGALVTLKAAAK